MRPDRVPATVEKLAEHVHDLEKKLKAAESGERRDLAADLLAGAVETGGLAVVAGSPQVETADELLTLVDEVRAKRDDCVVLLAVGGGRPRGRRRGRQRRRRGPRRARQATS